MKDKIQFDMDNWILYGTVPGFRVAEYSGYRAEADFLNPWGGRGRTGDGGSAIIPE